MADIYKIQLPGITVPFDLRDSRVDTLTGALTFLGVADGSGDTKFVDETSKSTGLIGANVKVGGANKTAMSGSVVVQGGLEYVFDGTKWRQLGDEGSYALKSELKGLAYKDSVSVSYDKANANTAETSITPAGSVTSTFTGTAATISASYKPEGSVTVTPTVALTSSTFKRVTGASLAATPAFTGTTATISVEGDTNVSVAPITYQPAGAVTVTPTISLTTATIQQITGVGTQAQHGADSYTPTAFAVNDTVLVITAGTFTSGTFTPNSLPTRASVTVATGAVASISATGSFTGTTATLTPSVTNGKVTATGSYTPEGSVSKPNITLTSTDQSYATGAVTSISATASFAGTTATIEADYTPAGEITSTFKGTAASHSHGIGTSKATVTGA